MEVDFLNSNYKCFISIDFLGGDIRFDVSNNTQLFSFKSGLGFIAIPHFLSTHSSLYKREFNKAELDCHGNSDYYIFSSNGIDLCVEHISFYPDGVFKYQFNLKHYIEAINTEFQRYLQQLEKDEVLPLKNQKYAHPLGDDVLSAFNDFSSILKN